jgi:hypothetical protein
LAGTCQKIKLLFFSYHKRKVADEQHQQREKVEWGSGQKRAGEAQFPSKKKKK